MQRQLKPSPPILRRAGRHGQARCWFDKTSLLSAIELGLTGSVQSLWRADPNYARQLLHRSTIRGKVTVKTIGPDGEQRYEALLDETGARSEIALEHQLAAFFGERTYLPQSLLGQLLQIYQESGSDADSPLAKFVGDLLGLDRLDALEVGLKPLTDVRNVRNIVEGWSQAEIEMNSVDKLLEDPSLPTSLRHRPPLELL